MVCLILGPGTNFMAYLAEVLLYHFTPQKDKMVTKKACLVKDKLLAEDTCLLRVARRGRECLQLTGLGNC